MQKLFVVYPGSFNPFHIGHLNIVEEAEYMFGKGNVTIAFGLSPKKLKQMAEKLGVTVQDLVTQVHQRAKTLSEKIGRECIVYDTFLHELIQKKEDEGYKVILVRGLRNGDDLNFEENQLKYIRQFKKDIHVVFIRCDEKYDHVSSSGIRELEDFRPGSAKNLIV